MSDKTGIDLMQWRPDYKKSKEENDEAYRRAYRDAYGEELPAFPSEEDFEKRLRAAKNK